MFVRGELAVRYVPVPVRNRGEVGVSIDIRRFLEMQSDGLARLPAGAGNSDDGARRVIWFVGLDRREAVQLGALKRCARCILATRDEEQAVLAECAGGGSAASRCH